MWYFLILLQSTKHTKKVTIKGNFKVKKDTMISEIVEKSSKAAEVMMNYGLSCAGCFLSKFENLEEGARLHGMTDTEIEEMIKEINGSLKQETV